MYSCKIRWIFSSSSSSTRQRTTIETLSNVHSSSTPIDILRGICEQCAISDVEYFDPVLCDGVIKTTRHRDLIYQENEIFSRLF